MSQEQTSLFDIQEIDTGDFGGVVSDSMRAQDLSGVKSVQAKKLNKHKKYVKNEKKAQKS